MGCCGVGIVFDMLPPVSSTLRQYVRLVLGGLFNFFLVGVEALIAMSQSSCSLIGSLKVRVVRVFYEASAEHGFKPRPLAKGL